MKVRVGQLRKMIREEYLRGVPEHALRASTEKYVEEIRQHIFRFILANKSQTEVDQRAALKIADEVLVELEEKANALLEDSLYQFIRQV